MVPYFVMLVMGTTAVRIPKVRNGVPPYHPPSAGSADPSAAQRSTHLLLAPELLLSARCIPRTSQCTPSGMSGRQGWREWGQQQKREQHTARDWQAVTRQWLPVCRPHQAVQQQHRHSMCHCAALFAICPPTQTRPAHLVAAPGPSPPPTLPGCGVCVRGGATTRHLISAPPPPHRLRPRPQRCPQRRHRRRRCWAPALRPLQQPGGEGVFKVWQATCMGQAACWAAQQHGRLSLGFSTCSPTRKPEPCNRALQTSHNCQPMMVCHATHLPGSATRLWPSHTHPCPHCTLGCHPPPAPVPLVLDAWVG